MVYTFSKGLLWEYLLLITSVCDWSVGYVVQGSNGEYAYMRPEEKVDLVRKVRQLATADKLILAGSGCEGLHWFYMILLMLI